jgi:tetratricopeptide (TPR) repeat protein
MKPLLSCSSPARFYPGVFKSTASVLSIILLLSSCLITSRAAGPQKSRQAKRGAKKPPAARPAKKAEASPKQPLPQSARELIDLAQAATSSKERINLLERALALRPDPPLDGQVRELLIREYALRGEQYLREANPQLAAKDFKAVFRLIPDPITDRSFGQYIFPLPVAMNAFGYRVESVDLMKSFESRFAANPNRLSQVGFFYIQIEAPLEAVRVMESVTQLAPTDSHAHNGLGTAFLINLRLEEAAAEFERAIELNPSDEFANLNLANVYRATGDNERAITYYRKQIRNKPGDAEAHGGLALSLLARGRDEEAEAEIKRATDLAPGDYRFLTQLAYYYTARRKPGLARPLVERAARVDPRYAWAHITKANIDLLESKYGDALSTLIAAQVHGTFPTLAFELAKTLMALDGYDQALEIMGRAFDITDEGEFETMLGGVVKARSPRLDLLLERERQASLLLNEHPTTTLQYRLAEALGRIDHYTKMAVKARKASEAPTARRRGKAAGQPAEDLKGASRPRRTREETSSTAELTAGRDAGLAGIPELFHAINSFTTLDDGRQAFRLVWVSRKLTETGVALDAAEQLARRAIAMADTATGPEGSMRDAPLLDREGRRAVFLGRAYDALGWALLKNGNTRGAIDYLSKSVDIYPESQEKRSVTWHLAVALEQAGDERRALDLYISSYEAAMPSSGVRRSHIESLYKKLNGSLAGLNEKLGRP